MKKNYNLATAFDNIAYELQDGKLTSTSFAAARSAIRFINTKLQQTLSDNQVFILAALMSNLHTTMKTSDFAGFADVSALRIIALDSDFVALEKLGYIECLKRATDNRWEQTYALAPGVIGAIRRNKPIEKFSYRELTQCEVLECIHCYLKSVGNSHMDYSALCSKIDALLPDCDNDPLFHYINQLNLSAAEKVILLACITWLIFQNDDALINYQYDGIIPCQQRTHLIGMFEFNTTRLREDNIIRHFIDAEEDISFQLTDSFINQYLGEYHVIKKFRADEQPESAAAAPAAPTIVTKQMFYNPKEQSLVSALTDLLQEQNLCRVRRRLADSGMRTGFTCLFYGAPGTGKTETVNQIARITGREIVRVNLSTIRNCYVGESEKNIQEIFDSYRAKLNESEISPILLFNEADAILCRRYSGALHAVDKMENALQNLLLQNLEDFDGILIATTNLTSSLDKAFERRFLYKIKFAKPDTGVRQMLWQSMIPGLADDDALALAREFAFSGGEIENVARKLLIDSIITNTPYTLESIRCLCQNECLSDPIHSFADNCQSD